MAEYKNPNPGLLKAEDVKEGDRVRILEEAYSSYNEEKDRTYWNMKVEISEDVRKLAGIYGESGDNMAKAWGTDTKKWIDKTVEIGIKDGKYITFYAVGDDGKAIKPEPLADVKAEDVGF
jgi:hypothetical protein|tara:strand:- start:4392 stop:4751 length:360 start_codon:yes stop_codon:yes gene_type:complete